MKKTFPVILICFFLVPLFSIAQKNNIKINLLALPLSNISLQDEYSLSGHSSIALGFSFMLTSKLPKFITKLDETGHMDEAEFSGSSFTPEYRYYFKGEGPKGLYISGYYRYSKYTTDKLVFTYDNGNGGNDEVVTNGDFTTSVFGIMLGDQYLLGEKFTLDWWIMGAGFGSQSGEFSGTGTFSDTQQQAIQKEAADLDVPLLDLKVETSSSEVKLNIDPKFPAMRMFGLCLGYRF